MDLLADLIRQVAPVPLSDISGEKLHVMLKDNKEVALEPFVELIDRTWSMDLFLNRACKAKPKSRKLENVRTAHRKWQSMLKKLILHKP